MSSITLRIPCLVLGVVIVVCCTLVLQLHMLLLRSDLILWDNHATPTTIRGSVPIQNLKTSQSINLAEDHVIPVASVSQKSSKSTWKNKTFCHDFIINTFHDEIPMCGGTEVSSMDQVKCYGSVYTNHMALCSYRNVAINPQRMLTTIPSDVSWKKPQDKTINLLQSNEVRCNSQSMDSLKQKTDYDDFQVKLTQHFLESEKLSPSVCDVWFNKTTLFHVSNAIHIYFKLLDLYSVHKTLFDYNIAEGHYQVLRIGNIDKSYKFPEFDKALFPGALTLDDIQANGTVCFKKVLLTPRSYQALPFRCKMNILLRKRCLECSGKDLTGSPLYTFRTRVLKACNITDYNNGKTSRLVIISRKPYQRWSSDSSGKFQRVLQNEDEMVTKIHKAFPHVTIEVIHMEDLGICEQVRYAVKADVMLGVHGAGLVHFWWLRDKATAIELEPAFQTGNPSFKMLTTLAGRNYVSERIRGTSKSVSVNIDQVLQTLGHYF